MAKLGHAEGAVSKHSKELRNAVQDEACRREIDAAKKRAAAQNADYPTFVGLVSLSCFFFRLASFALCLWISFLFHVFLSSPLPWRNSVDLERRKPENEEKGKVSLLDPNWYGPWICMPHYPIGLSVPCQHALVDARSARKRISQCQVRLWNGAGLNFRFHCPTMSNSIISSPLVCPGQ